MLKAFTLTTLLLAAVAGCTPSAPAPAGNPPAAAPAANQNTAPPSNAPANSTTDWDASNVMSPVLGSADAKVTIEEFADYQ